MQFPERMELNVADAMKLVGDLCLASRFDDAGRLLGEVLKAEPGNFHAANLLGVCCAEMNRHEEAIRWFDRAGTLLRDEVVATACNRGKSLGELGRDQEAIAVFDSILRGSPGYLIARYNRGLMLMQMGQHREALAEIEQVLAAEPDNANAKFANGFSNLVLGHYREGFAGYEHRLKDELVEPDAKLWDGSQAIGGKTILIHGEQGLGDNIMFARYLPLLVARGAKVLVWTPKPLRPLFSHLAGVTILGDDRDAWPRCDLWARFMSLAYCFRTDEGSVPPPVRLHYDVAELAEWHHRTDDDCLNVGLCWNGSTRSKYDSHRSVPLADLAPLFKVSGVRLFSLQLGLRDSDRAAFEVFDMVDLAPHLTDFRATAHAMKNLDLIVTVDTSVAHLAGTVGVPTFVMLSAFRAYWLWLAEREDSPWYPSVTVFRQARDGGWSDVVARICDALRQRVRAEAA